MLLPDVRSIINVALISSPTINQEIISQDASVENVPVLQNYRPVVIWHGLGDNYNSSGIRTVVDLFDQHYPGIEVYSIALDQDASNDQQMSVFGDANAEVEQTCEKLSKIASLSSGFDAIGFSQGGLFLRALAQKCLDINVANLITFGSPHMGISELPLCKQTDWICKRRNAFLKRQVWHDSVQKRVIPAQYFRDPKELDKYLQYSNFLADINNERESINKTYSSRLSNLENLVLIDFLQDTTLVPKESAKFYDVSPNDDLIEYNQTKIYQQDRLGLKSLDDANKIQFLSIDADHMDISPLFLEDIATKYIGTLI